MSYRTPQIGAAIRSLLMATPEVYAMVGERIYPQLGPQGGPFPLLVYSVRHEPVQTQEGRSRLDRFEVGIDCWARARDGVSPYDEAHALAAEVQAALLGYIGSAAGVRIHSVTGGDSYDDGADEETGIYSVGVEFTVWAHTEEAHGNHS